ncbi:MAG: putative sugar phosphate isomerase YwlF [Myxococcota bacterium]|nr:putative sugar phosphate isomerase YwlF [Myxococcota bacterium]
MKIPVLFIANDHAAVDLKRALASFAAEAELAAEIRDFGVGHGARADYPDQAHALTQAVLKEPGSMGVLLCGTGLGMSMAANRRKGIRAAVCVNEYMARMAREHNDANVLCMGARVTGDELAKAILRAFLTTPFEGGRHEGRVRKIDAPLGESR